MQRLISEFTSIASTPNLCPTSLIWSFARRTSRYVSTLRTQTSGIVHIWPPPGVPRFPSPTASLHSTLGELSFMPALMTTIAQEFMLSHRISFALPITSLTSFPGIPWLPVVSLRPTLHLRLTSSKVRVSHQEDHLPVCALSSSICLAIDSLICTIFLYSSCLNAGTF